MTASLIRVIALAAALAAARGLTAQLAPGYVQEQLADGLNPSAMTLGPDGRLFVVEKGGRILTYRDGRLLDEPFLDIEVDDFNERGLGGVSFHPDFARQPYAYVYYTVPRRGVNRVSRFRVNGDFAVPGSEEVLYELDELSGSSIHNGGAMLWLPDTTLLVAVGDGGVADRAQVRSSTLGKLLRIGADGSIPADNPFLDDGAAAPALYALGLRNPFTMALQPSTGRVFVNDVGGSSWEEVNEAAPGANYGWPLVEGPDGLDQAPPAHREAVHAYSHDEGCAVVGAAFYEPAAPQPGSAFPTELAGKYLFGDYCTGEIRVLDPESGIPSAPIASGLDRVVALAVDSTGALYYLARGTGDGSRADNTSTAEGSLWRIRYTGSGAPLVSRQPASALVPRGESARFEVRVSGRPPYRYQWLRDGVSMPGDTSRVLELPPVDLADDGAAFRCVVRNDQGVDTSARAVLSVTANQRPRVAIDRPGPDATYAAGDTLRLRGAAVDPEQGELPARALAWRIVFHHDDHTHPVVAFDGTETAEYVVPTLGEVSSDVFYRVHLTAVDSGLLASTTHVDVAPELTDLTFVTDPPGLQLNADGLSRAAPFAVESVVGLERVVRAPPAQVLDGEVYAFTGWTAPRAVDSSVLAYVAPPEPTAFTAAYRRLPKGSGTGLLGRYYAGDGALPGATPLHERVDSTVAFDWGWAAPAPGVPADGFFVRWTGELEPVLGGEHRFTVGSDDGVRLYVDGQLLIDNWRWQDLTYRSAGIDLEAGRHVPVVLEYFDGVLDAEVSLVWEHAFLPQGPVPTWALYPTDGEPIGPPAVPDDPDSLSLSFAGSFPRSGVAAAWVRLPAGVREGRIAVYDYSGRDVGAAPVAGEPGEWLRVEVSVLPGAGGLYVMRAEAGGESAVLRFSAQP